MELMFGKGSRPKTSATLEHLDDRVNGQRGKHSGQIRIVLACKECNQKRGRELVKSQPIEDLWAKSGAYTQGHNLGKDYRLRGRQMDIKALLSRLRASSRQAPHVAADLIEAQVEMIDWYEDEHDIQLYDDDDLPSGVLEYRRKVERILGGEKPRSV